MLKAGEGVVDQRAVMLGDFPLELGGNDSFDEYRLVRQGPLLLSPPQHVVRIERPELISRYEAELLSVLLRDGDADPVGVGIGPDNHVGLLLLAELQSHGESRGLLGVGRLHRRKLSIRFPLFGHGVHRHPELSEDPFDHHRSGAVQRRVDHRHLAAPLSEELRADGGAFHHFHEL